MSTNYYPLFREVFFSTKKRIDSSFLLRIFILIIISNNIILKAQLAEGHDKFLGNIIGGSIPSDFIDYWNQVTPENAGKWGSAEPSKDSYNWGGLDNIYNYAKTNDLPYKHHTLIWGSQYPAWIANITNLEEKADQIEEWIRLVSERYPEMDFVDVVNEPLHAPPDKFMDAMGGSGTTGWDWVIWAFEKAREYMPEAKLILNDYGIINDNSSTNKLIVIINLLKERNLIDAIGIQGHSFELSNTSAATMNSNLNKLAATGLPIYISEFDINEVNDETQRQKYSSIFPVLWEHPGVRGITLWGYIQGQIWQQNGYLVRTNGTERPALEWLRDYLSGTVDIEETASELPKTFSLEQNYPNPFNPSTKIKYIVPTVETPYMASLQTSLKIYNVLGREVATLVDDDKNPGIYEVEWDASGCPSGVYICKLSVSSETDNFVLSKKMMLVK
ncbi:MAG: endo-1,4-beta-xylanase [bacterium]